MVLSTYDRGGVREVKWCEEKKNVGNEWWNQYRKKEGLPWWFVLPYLLEPRSLGIKLEPRSVETKFRVFSGVR